jgi:hypothetical protein
MNNIKYLLILPLILIALTSPIVNATDLSKPDNRVNNAKIDESNIIFPACRLSNLHDESGIITEKTRQQYLPNCIQEILRFIIVLASVSTIVYLGFQGTGHMLGYNILSKKRIQDLVIGFFLLIVGWNLVPILNQSLGNTFLVLPQINYQN